jgi:hypothetical protein
LYPYLFFSFLLLGVVYTPAPAVPCNLTSAHTCLQSDIEENLSLPDISSTQIYYYAIAVTGACPRRVSIWQQIVASEDYFLMTLSTVYPFPDPTNSSQFSDLIIFEDFTTHSIAMSFCPSDLTKPTIVYIALERQSLTATTLLLRATANPVNFVTLPLNVAAPTSYDMGHLMLRKREHIVLSVELLLISLFIRARCDALRRHCLSSL